MKGYEQLEKRILAAKELVREMKLEGIGIHGYIK
jgi:hypothetical protein